MKTAYPRVKKSVCNVLALGGRTESCILSGGKIKPALSASLFAGGPAEKPVDAFYSSSDDRLYYYGGSLNFTDDFENFFTMGAVDSEPFAYTEGGTGNYGFITATKHFRRKDSGYSVSGCNGGVRDGIYKNGRIFGVDINDGYTVKWSAAGGADNWEGDAGYVRINTRYGGILKLVIFKEYAVAVCKYGLAVLSAYGTPENFKLSYPLPPLPEIYKNTACVVGAELYFAAADGIYCFDGGACEKLGESRLNVIKTPVYAAALGNNYFLLGRNGGGKSTVAVYGTDSGESYYFYAEADVLAAGDRVYGLGRGTLCAFEKGGKFLFTSKSFNFGAGGGKVLSALEITADGCVDVEIKSGVKSRIYRGVNGILHPKIYGENFEISISGYAEISAVNAVAEVIDGV